MRRKLLEADLIECVLGLGPNLFYNSPLEACVVICPTAKPRERRGRILFVNAVNGVTRERAQSFLTDQHTDDPPTRASGQFAGSTRMNLAELKSQIALGEDSRRQIKRDLTGVDKGGRWEVAE